jgi:hypothetical protein
MTIRVAEEGVAMIFRAKAQPQAPGLVAPATSLEARLAALGRLLDERGYAFEGLCVLAVNDGFEVYGLRHDQSEVYTLDATELAEALAARNTPPRGSR